MKKLLFIFFLLCFSVIVNGQTYQGPLGGNGTWHNRIDVDQTFGIPFGPTPSINVTGARATRPGRLWWKDDDNTIWGWTGVSWIQVGGTSQNIYNTSATIEDEDRTVTIVPGRSLIFISQDDDEVTRSIQAKSLYQIDYRDKGDGKISKFLVDATGVALSQSDALNAHLNKFWIDVDGGHYTGGITGQSGIAYTTDYSDRSPLTLVTNQFVADQIALLNLQQVNTYGNETTLPIKFMGESGADKFSWLYGADNATRSGDPDFPDVTGEFKWMLPRGNMRSHLIGSGIEKRTLATSLDGVFADQYGDLSSSALSLFYRHDGFMFNDPSSYNPDLGTNEPDDGSRDVDVGDLFLKWTNSPGHYWETESALVKMWLGLPYDGWRVENPTGSVSFSNAFRITATTTPENKAIFDLSNITIAGIYTPRMTSTQRDALVSGDILSGLQLFNTTTNQPEYWDGSSWIGMTLPSSYVANVTGTANRITVTTLGGPTKNVDIASTYVGQASITTLGTIGTGTWQGSVIGTTYGGTGLSSLGTSLQMLRVNSGATALEYFTPAFGTVSDVDLEVTNGTALADDGTHVTSSGTLNLAWQGNANELVDGAGNNILKSSINLSDFNNDAGFGVGTVTEFDSDVLSGLDGAGGTVALNVSVDNATTTPSLHIEWQGNSTQYVNGNGDLITFPSFVSSESDPVWTAASGNYLLSSTAASTYALKSITLSPAGGTPLSISGTGDLSANRTIGISKATGSVDGYLGATDFASFAAKQAALVSGTNIKTVNGSSLLGSGNLAVGDVLSTASNTYTAGMKQIFSSSATTAGLNFAGVSSDPSSLSNGDMWMNTTSNTFKYRVNGTTRIFANLDESQTFTNKTMSGSSNTFSNIGNSSLTNSSITIAGNSTALGGSVTLDNITGLSSTGLVKRTAANTLAIATSGTDYAPATSGTSPLKGNGSGGFTSGVATTDLSDVTEWTDYSSTSTITGFSAYTTKVLRYKIVGKSMTIDYNLIGTGSGTTTTFTLPNSISSTGNQVWFSHVKNNTTQAAGYTVINASGNTVTFSISTSDGNTGGWTDAVNRTVQGQAVLVLP